MTENKRDDDATEADESTEPTATATAEGEGAEATATVAEPDDADDGTEDAEPTD